MNEIIEICVLRFFWLIVGMTSLALGAAGMVLPLLPTTPFVLLAAFCFGKSSPRFHAWLLAHRVFGPAIRDWNEQRAISRRAKTLAVAAMLATLLISVGSGVSGEIIALQALALAGSAAFILTRNSS